MCSFVTRFLDFVYCEDVIISSLVLNLVKEFEGETNATDTLAGLPYLQKLGEWSIQMSANNL